MNPYDSSKFGGEYSTGPLTTETRANYDFTANKYADNTILPGLGGTRSNVVAATGRFDNSPYEKKGGARVTLDPTQHPSNVIGPNTGHPEHSSYVPSPQPRDLHHSFSNKIGGRRYKARRHKTRKSSNKSSNKSRRRKNNKSYSRKNNKSSSRRRSVRRRVLRRHMRGGSGIPFSNVPMSWGYSLGQQLPSNLNALANPPPMTTYNNCATIKRG
jgi:hypothetical protein